MHPLTGASKAIVLAALLGGGYASLVERNLFTLRRYCVPVLPPGAQPVRLLHLSDLHLMPGQHRKVEWVRALAALDPHVVVDTGDNIAHPQSVEVLMRAFEPFLHLPGVFVLGSNDYFRPQLKNPARYLLPHDRKRHPRSARLPTDRLVSALCGAGWVHLRNARTEVTAAGTTFSFVGVDDPHLDYDRYPWRDAGRGIHSETPTRGERRQERAVEVANPSPAVTVGVAHAPYKRVLDAMTADGARLVIAGHTHGGQLCLPGLGALVTNCDLDRKRAKGLSRWWPGAGASQAPVPADAAYLEVSAGLGTSPMAPVRFACRPEASLLTLTAADETPRPR